MILTSRPLCLFGVRLSLLLASLTLHAVAKAADSISSPAIPSMAGESAGHPSSPALPTEPGRRQAHFNHERVSNATRKFADWVVDSGDNGKLAFAIVDKVEAKVFVFFADGRLRGTAPALLGLAVGDKSVPGIGDRPLSSIRPDERTTPPGRFVATLDYNLNGKEILWVDYHGAISMHPVVSSNPKERRLQRLNSSTPLDNRISFGCINVPPNFFKTVVRPTFTGTEGIVYILPDTKSLKDVFTGYTEASSKQSVHKN